MAKVEDIVLCHVCEHDPHKHGECKVIRFYTRGPNNPPGNQRCLCGYGMETCSKDCGTSWTPGYCDPDCPHAIKGELMMNNGVSWGLGVVFGLVVGFGSGLWIAWILLNGS